MSQQRGFFRTPQYKSRFLLKIKQKTAFIFGGIQAYFQQNRLKLSQIDKFIRVDIAIEHIFTPEAVLLFRKNFNH
jgi:hypothetical protein